MIQHTLFTVTLSLLLLTGCGKKQPNLNDLDTGLNNVSDVTQIAGETVTIDENMYKKDTENNQKIATSATYNSSNDGFQSIYFGFGAYGISTDMENHITTNVQRVNTSDMIVKIEGNCDEFGTDEYNYALGLKRAKAVKDSIVSQGVSASKMVIISFGESNPVCSNPTDTCYSQNRRVDLHLVK